MTERIKNYLGVALIIAVLVGALAVIKFSYSYSRSVDPFTSPTITAAGEGKVTAIPDVAQFTFSVITEGGENVSALQEENTKKVNKIIEFLKSNGVAQEDIQTQNYNIEPRQEFFSCPPRGGVCPPPEIVGYTINQTVTVKVRDFSKVNSILPGVVKNGANHVSQLTFTIDDPTELQNQARAKAIEQAKRKAEAIAKAAGVKLGKLLRVDEIPYYASLGYGGKGGGNEFDIAVPSTPVQIEPGSEEIIITLNLIYEVK